MHSHVPNQIFKPCLHPIEMVKLVPLVDLVTSQSWKDKDLDIKIKKVYHIHSAIISMKELGYYVGTVHSEAKLKQGWYIRAFERSDVLLFEIGK